LGVTENTKNIYLAYLRGSDECEKTISSNIKKLTTEELLSLINLVHSLRIEKYNSQIIHLPLFLEQVPKIENVFNYEGYENYISWCQARGFKQMPFYHYDIEAHQELAQLILNIQE
jgi:hypothetical protein